MFNPANNIVFMERVCRALGIDPVAQPVCKIVIEISVEDVVRIHVQQVLDHNQAEDLAELLSEAKDNLEVITTARPVIVDALGNVRRE